MLAENAAAPATAEVNGRRDCVEQLGGRLTQSLGGASTKSQVRIYGRRHLLWRGDKLCAGRTILLRLVTDARWPQMRRIQYRDGRLSDLLNVARARDAAMATALREINGEETPLTAPPIAAIDPGATTLAETLGNDAWHDWPPDPGTV